MPMSWRRDAAPVADLDFTLPFALMWRKDNCWRPIAHSMAHAKSVAC